MRTKLSTKYVDALPPANGKRYEARDALIPGLHIRVSVTGAKVWYVGTRIDGRVRRIRLGPYPLLSLADARKAAASLLRDVQLGRFADPDEQPRTPTLGEIVPQFIEIYAKPRNRAWRDTKSALRKFAPLNGTPVDRIKRADVVRVMDTLMASGPSPGANRALAALKKLMNWCVDRGVIEVSPIVGLAKPAKEVARERVLNDRELAACWHAAHADGYPFAAFAQLLILTAQRRGEVAGMRWSELDLDEATWTIPGKRTKNATTHVVPLAAAAIDILCEAPRFLGSDLVFTTNGTTPISGFGRLKRRLDNAVGLDAEDWRLHDIRRTVATNMAKMGIQPHIIEAVLNHKTGIVSGVAAIYNRHAYLDEKRDALEKWAKRLADLVDGRSHKAKDDRKESIRGAERSA